MLNQAAVVETLKQIAEDYLEVVRLLYNPFASRHAHHMKNVRWLERYLKELEMRNCIDRDTDRTE